MLSGDIPAAHDPDKLATACHARQRGADRRDWQPGTLSNPRGPCPAKPTGVDTGVVAAPFGGGHAITAIHPATPAPNTIANTTRAATTMRLIVHLPAR